MFLRSVLHLKKDGNSVSFGFDKLHLRSWPQTGADIVDTRRRDSVQPQSLRFILSPARLHHVTVVGHELVYCLLSQMTVTITGCVNLCSRKYSTGDQEKAVNSTKVKVDESLVHHMKVENFYL